MDCLAETHFAKPMNPEAKHYHVSIGERSMTIIGGDLLPGDARLHQGSRGFTVKNQPAAQDPAQDGPFILHLEPLPNDRLHRPPLARLRALLKAALCGLRDTAAGEPGRNGGGRDLRPLAGQDGATCFLPTTEETEAYPKGGPK